MTMSRWTLALPFAAALVWAQFHESGRPELRARLTVATEPRMPVRAYLFKDDKPFRLSPVEAMLPLRVDMFYRERLWTRGDRASTLEVTCRDQSHYVLLEGGGSFDLPAGKYRIEAYRGFFYAPATEEFELEAGKERQVTLRMRDWAPGESRRWISGDDHIHLTRELRDNDVFLRWLEAEDLHVANFLQLQRQMDAAVQYAFGPPGEAKRNGYAIRPGHESRTEFYGHVNLLGGRELIRPLSAGSMYANSPGAYPYPAILFAKGRELGATVGYAHFSGSMPHSTLLMDLALGNIDFVEVLQFGVLKTGEWYELLNAGLRVTGIAGSDFPVLLNQRDPWPRTIPLLGPERTLVKADGGQSPYEAWAAGVRTGTAIVTNGPLVEATLEKNNSVVTAKAGFYRPLEKLEIIRNGEVIAAVSGDGGKTELSLSARVPAGESCWLAARATARKKEGEPDIQGHTNPFYIEANGRPYFDEQTRRAVAGRWEEELAHYRNAGLRFPDERSRDDFFARGEQALRILTAPPAQGRR
ncbi:MAG: CehA/McbA family metallohydrolase [Bryobacteraceae bacterium]|nr:CehA/McbA family metallohydrolase [Bryobacteraceae bacterium]